ncbi:bifunctional MutL [Babesia duncani]|uniref:Bifunctional MutL n=1 Tax=Babesia duncani TaxID=323732 RepID=A0AAD9PJS8_9APIC|nr:bifunctional MutL [Babesia duncani]
MAIDTLNAFTSSCIRSLQVIGDVKSVVKELVENALDAGATEIEVKLVNHGTSLIQVSDNGHGIHEKNFEMLALKHTTSKIQHFNDLFSTLNTFGFRVPTLLYDIKIQGEALNAIANLSNLEIETRTQESDLGWLLKYDKEGKLSDKNVVSTRIGTIVRCSGLFSEYPVRLNSLMKTQRSQSTSTASLLLQYALLNYRTRFNLINVSSGTKISNLFTSSGACENIREAAKEIFGTKLINQTFDINIETNNWSLTGLISSSTFNHQVKDMQFFFINGRPIDDVRKIRKCIIEVYKRFSSRHHLMYILNLVTAACNIDINVAPDKRQAFLLTEDDVIEHLMEELMVLYKPRTNSESVVKASINIGSQIPMYSQDAQFSSYPLHSQTVETIVETTNEVNSDHKVKIKEDDECVPIENLSCASGLNEDKSIYESPFSKSYKRRHLTELPIRSPFRLWDACKISKVKDDPIETTSCSEESSTINQEQQITNDVTKDNTPQSQSPVWDLSTVELPKVEHEDDQIVQTISVDLSSLYLVQDNSPFSLDLSPRVAYESNNNEPMDTEFLDPTVFLKMEVIGQFNNGFIITRLPDEHGYSIYIIDQHAANEKDRFALNNPIESRFERYNKQVRIFKQPLVSPLKMDLSPYHQQIAEDNINVLSENGFNVSVSKDDNILYLESLGQFMGHTLTVDDFISFVHTLEDHKSVSRKVDFNDSMIWGNSQVLPRPKRIWDILASKFVYLISMCNMHRACKSAVRLGDPLSMAQMQSIVSKLATLIHPWNCPHGRPTLKCLVKSNQLLKTP